MADFCVEAIGNSGQLVHWVRTNNAALAAAVADAWREDGFSVYCEREEVDA
jgi:hypothetical protein